MIKENECYLELYDEVQEELKFLTNSEIRLKILKYLSELPITIKELCLASNLTYNAVSHNVHRLEDYGYLNS